MANRILATYGGDDGGPHTFTFPAPTAGARLILLVSSYDPVTQPPAGWTQDYAVPGYNRVYVYSKIATGSETSVSLTAVDFRLHAVLHERDDCPDLLFKTYRTFTGASGSAPAVTVPEGTFGHVFSVVNNPEGDSGFAEWNHGLARHYWEIVTDCNSIFAHGGMPAAGSRTYSVSGLATDLGVNSSVFAVVGYGAADPEPPTTPANLRATSITGTQISVEWDPSTDNVGVSGYGVWLDGVRQVPDQAGLSYVFTGLTAGQAYTLGVDAADAAGGRSARAELVVTAEVDVTAPTVPGALRVAAADYNSVSLAWDASTDSVGVAGYGVYVGEVKQGVADQAGLEATVSRLERGTSYTFGVDAVDSAGNRSARATLVAATLAGGDPSAPADLTATAGQEQITVAWTAAEAGAEPIVRYEVLLNGLLVAATTALGYVVEELDAGVTYEVAVRAVDEGGVRGPSSLVSVEVPAADWMAIASPVYRVGSWAANVRDAHGVAWVVEEEDGWSSSAPPVTLSSDSDASDGGFSGPGKYGARLVTLSGTAIAPTNREMIAAQERLTGVVSPRDSGVLRVAEAHLTRQARVRLQDEIQVVDEGPLAFSWTLVMRAPDPRRYARRGVYAEVVFAPAQTSGSAVITLEGDYPGIPARMRLVGPVADPVIRLEELGLEIRAKAGTILPDARYELTIDLSSRAVWMIVPADVWPEPRPGRPALAVFPARFALQGGPNTITLSGGLVAGQESTSPRLVVEAIDAWL